MLEICSEVRPPAGQDPDVVGLGVRFLVVRPSPAKKTLSVLGDRSVSWLVR